MATAWGNEKTNTFGAPAPAPTPGTGSVTPGSAGVPDSKPATPATSNTSNDSAAGAGKSDEAAAKKKDSPARKPRARRAATPTGLTKTQVTGVIDVYDRVTDASDEVVEVLAEVYRTDADATDLTVAITSGSKASTDPVQDLLDLHKLGEENMMAVGASLAGMERSVRNRVQKMFETVAGKEVELPKQEFQAVAALGTEIISLTDTQIGVLEQAQQVRGL